MICSRYFVVLATVGLAVLSVALSVVAFAPPSKTFPSRSYLDSDNTLVEIPVQRQAFSVLLGTSFTAESRMIFRRREFAIQMTDKPTEEKSSLPVFLDPGTKGGVVVLSIILFIIPFIAYNVVTSQGVSEEDAGRFIGVGFTVVTSLLWASTYIFRVATKDMTYAKQLKDYENAVIAKRLEELDEDELQAMMEDIEREKADEF